MFQVAGTVKIGRIKDGYLMGVKNPELFWLGPKSGEMG